MTLTQLSDMSMSVAAVIYLVAFALHGAEWARARDLSPTRQRGDEASRLRVDLWGRYAVAATVVAWLLNMVGVVTRGIAAHRPPWGNMYEFSTSLTALAVGVHLLLVWLRGMRWLGIGITLLASLAMGLAVTVFYVEVSALLPALHSLWFVIHILAASVAGAAFNVAFVATVLYLVKDRAEQRGNVRGYLARIPDGKKLDVFAYRMHAFAFPLWTFAIVAGAIWAQFAWGRFWNWDPKETWSFVTWVIYAAYLHARATAGWRGRRAAIIALIGWASFWFNFIGVNLLFGGLHAYSGI